MESTDHQHQQQQITAITVEPGAEMNSGGAGRRMAGTSNVTSVDDRRPKKDSQYAMGASDDAEPYGICTKILIVLSYILTIITFPISVFMCIKIVQQYERAVIFRLGQLKKGGAKGPGLFFIIPCIDEYRKVDLRVVSFQVPPQEILSKDSVTVEVDAVIYFRVKNATISIVNVENATGSTKLLAQTTLRNVLGIKTLSEMLSDREHISAHMQEVLDEATENWGVKVERVEVKDIRLPREMQRAMAAEAEASREAKAKVIAAEGEQKASRALREAAMIISEAPSALQLRYLQTLGTIAAEHNSTIVFPVPVDMMASFMQSSAGYGGHGRPHGYAPQTPQQVNNYIPPNDDGPQMMDGAPPAFVP